MTPRPWLVVLAVPVLVGALTGCGAVANKADSIASNAVNNVANKAVSAGAEQIVGAAFTDALTKAGVTLDGNPTCTSKLKTDVAGLTVKGTVACSGKTTKKQTATSTLSGVIAVGTSSTSCTGRFIVKLSGKTKVNKDVNVCTLARAN
jgi:hypothetical protein